MSTDTDPTYERRYCAFVDILGFSQLIDELGKHKGDLEFVRRLLLRIHAPQLGPEDADYRAQSISDAVAISSKPTPAGLLHICLTLEALAIDLLCRGYFVRGAIVKGMLYHDQHTVFGEALIKAYHLESHVARFPRIMISRPVLIDMKKFSVAEPSFLDRFRLSTDGPAILHVLGHIERAIERERREHPKVSLWDSDALADYRGIPLLIDFRFEKAIDNPRHFEKINWFAEYWNHSVATLGYDAFAPINGISPYAFAPSLTGEDD
jgi:hypothetical protein